MCLHICTLHVINGVAACRVVLNPSNVETTRQRHKSSKNFENHLNSVMFLLIGKLSLSINT